MKDKRTYPFSLSSLPPRSFLLSSVIMQHTSHFNTGLSALSERGNLVLVMKTYIPAPLPERGGPIRRLSLID